MGKKILILDDEGEYIVALKDFLRELDYTVAVTMFPNDALDIIKKHKPDLVLFDYKLPEMDGDTFFKKAKSLYDASKYILITAYRDEAIVDKFKKLGVNDVVLKPIDLNSLLHRIKDILKEG